MITIKTENLSFTYNISTPFEKAAVKNINIEINQGEFVGIIGHTGSGKSTLIQHFNGLIKPTQGHVFIDGVDIWESKKTLKEVRKKVGLVFQYPEYQLFAETVFDDIAFGPKNLGLKSINTLVEDAARIVGLDPGLLRKSPFELSGGQKRRAAIAGVIAMKPKILILDEPIAGLDPMGKDEMLKLICEYRKETGATVLFITHNMDDIVPLATKILVLNQGEIFAYDDVKSVFSKSAELSEMGLSVPYVTKVLLELKARGCDVNTDAYTVEEAVAEIRAALSKG